MRRVDQQTTQSGTQIAHTASPTPQFIEAHGPGRPPHLEMGNASHPARGDFASELRRLHRPLPFDKATLFVDTPMRLTTPVPAALYAASRHPVPSTHRMFETLPQPSASGNKGRRKGSIVVESSGNYAMFGPMPASLAGARLAELKQAPTTTGAAVAATTAAAAAGTTAAAGAAAAGATAADAAVAPAAPADAAAAGGDSGGSGFGTILVVLVVAVVLVGGAAAAAKAFMGKKNVGRLDGVKDGPDSQYWKSAKARQNYRKSQLSTENLGNGSDDSDKDDGAVASGRGGGMIQADGNEGKTSSYRSRRDQKREPSQDPKKSTDDDSGEVVAKSSSYRGRRQQQQAKKEAASDDVTV